MATLFDAHCHLDFADNAKQTARDSAGRVNAICSTVEPSSFVAAKFEFEQFDNIHVGLGIHPWWISDNRAGEVDIARFEDLCKSEKVIGEIGLDFSSKHKHSRDRQLAAFERELRAIRDSGDGKVVFLHVVHAYDTAFQLLDRFDTFKGNKVVFHWFQGTPDDFGRALAGGAMFSIGMRMMAKSAGEYFAKSCPADSLLMETDNPPHPGMPYSIDLWEEELKATAKSLAELRSISEEEVVRITNENSSKLL